MNEKHFIASMEILRKFFDDRGKITAMIKELSNGNGFCEFGDELIDEYIHHVECMMPDDNEWIRWFVWENDWGKKNMLVKLHGKPFPCTTFRQLYNLINLTK